MPPIGLNPAGVVAFVLFDLALILVVARLMGGLAKRIGQPSVVGEIIAGVLLGPSLLGLIKWTAVPSGLGFLNCTQSLEFRTALQMPAWTPTATTCLFPTQAQSVLNLLGSIALLLFMFLVGLELDFGKLKGFGKSIGLVTLGVVAVPVAFGFVIGPMLFGATTAAGDPLFVGANAADNPTAFYLFIGAALSVTALPVMARILQEKGLAQTQMGAIGVAAAAAVTVLMFVLVAVAGLIARNATTGRILVQLLLVVLYLAVMWFLVRPIMASTVGKKYRQKVAARGGPADPKGWSEVDEFAPAGIGWAQTHGQFAAIIVMVFASGLVAHLLGLNVIVGGFMAGVVLPAREGLARDMLAELFDITVIVLLPVFLAFSGLNTDFTQLFGNFGAAAVGLVVFLIAAIVSKMASAAVFGKLGGLSWKEGNALGVLMNCRGLLPLVPALIALQSGLISPVGQVTIVTMALITTIMTGPLFDRLNPAPAPPAAPVAAAGRPKRAAGRR